MCVRVSRAPRASRALRAIAKVSRRVPADRRTPLPRPGEGKGGTPWCARPALLIAPKRARIGFGGTRRAGGIVGRPRRPGRLHKLPRSARRFSPGHPLRLIATPDTRNYVETDGHDLCRVDRNKILSRCVRDSERVLFRAHFSMFKKVPLAYYCNK